ncbi:hypothetical protein, partial [Schnuerera sp.]|uniref:hypothetical protein n=1 Tax=Schnuerera sp. TaxID=2794844 RepID=UPI002BAEA448
MKIKDFVNSKKLFLETRKDFFKKGNLIKGEILETDDNTALIKIENIGMIKASSEQPLDSHKGKTLNFIIVDIFPDKIFLKPIFNDIEQNTTFFSENNKEEYLTNILKEFNIKPSPTSIDFLDNLIKFNLPINKNNLVSGIGVLDKLVHFINTKDDEMIILANNNKEIINVEKEDIRNFIVVKEDVDKLQMNFKDNINIVIKKSINNFSTNKIDNRLIKTIIFFLKYDIKPTLNNIKYFLELNENLTLFSKDFEKIKDIMDKKFTNQMKRIMIDIGSPKNQIEKNSSKYNKSLDKLIDFIKDYGSNANSKFNDNIEEIVNKIQ